MISVIFLIFTLIPDFLLGCLEELVHFLTPSWFRRKKSVSGQNVLITGAGSGLGRQMAIEFSKHSVCLIMIDVNRSSLINTEKLLDRSSRTFIYECDVSDRERVYQVARIIREEVGKVDILVNNAAIVSGKRFLEISDDKIEKTMKVNSLAHLWMCKAFLPDMMQSNKGHIVSIASLAGVSGLPNLTDYCASKFAAVGFMESLKLELDAQKKDGIKLTIVCPSLISTGLFEGTKPPLTVLMTAEYVAGEIIRAVLEETEFVMLPRWMYIIILFKWTMPRRAVERFYANSGLLEFMDTFRGRSTNNNSNQIQKT
ncbi:short-chain dehydrogenase/reductase family 16C member 6-like isoform X2 [Argiope bruennichi]|uniref:short-chain dehydrogenase/reductase family 16C member 6-like isoform X2 n=1 Tax=Argiope bruennichi TaxID=94029 RepID=UPI0024959F4E|nr:short-chain dehydrogenase/reductase family 16C member 6-like isoform X2 [Argiope bruennichi]